MMTQINITINLEDLKEKIENSSLESPVKASLDTYFKFFNGKRKRRVY